VRAVWPLRCFAAPLLLLLISLTPLTSFVFSLYRKGSSPRISPNSRSGALGVFRSRVCAGSLSLRLCLCFCVLCAESRSGRERSRTHPVFSLFLARAALPCLPIMYLYIRQRDKKKNQTRLARLSFFRWHLRLTHLRRSCGPMGAQLAVRHHRKAPRT
jgi:hypothetical protein